MNTTTNFNDINEIDVSQIYKQMKDMNKFVKLGYILEIQRLMKEQILDKYKKQIVKNKTKSKVKITEDVVNNIINSFKSKTGDKLNEKSYDVYIKKAKRMEISKTIQNIIDNQDDKDEINKLIDIIKQRKYIKIKRKEETKASAYSDVVFISQLMNYPIIKKQLNQYVQNRFNKLSNELKNIKLDIDQEKTLFEKLPITYQQYQDLVKKINESDTIKINDVKYTPTIDHKILLNLYAVYPLRDDWGQIRLVDKDMDNENENYINIENSIFHLNQYKSSSMRIFGKKQYRIPQHIMNLIKTKYDNGWRVLFGRTKTEFYKDTRLSKKFQKIMNIYYKEHQISINDVRRATTTYFNENKSVKAQKRMADIMNHSFQTARKSYNREQNEE